MPKKIKAPEIPLFDRYIFTELKNNLSGNEFIQLKVIIETSIKAQDITIEALLQLAFDAGYSAGNESGFDAGIAQYNDNY